MNSKQLAYRLGIALLVVTVALLAATSPVVADNETDTENAYAERHGAVLQQQQQRDRRRGVVSRATRTSR